MITHYIECWLPLQDYEGLYEVSDLGNVARIRDGKRIVLRPKDGGQVCTVTLFRGTARRYPLVHTLVARHFVLNPQGYEYILHADGNHRNNVASNLRWCPFENKLNPSVGAGQRGLRHGEECNLAKLTADKAKEIFIRYHQDGVSAARLGREYGILPVSVHRILNRESWRRATDGLPVSSVYAHAGQSVVETLEGEEWRDIKGYEGLYRVSSFGRVQSLNRVSTNSIAKGGVRRMHGRLLELNLDTKGYYYVSFCREGKYKRFHVHRLVANHFVPNLKSLPVVNHIDLNPRNNRVENLEWTSQYRNLIHTRKMVLTDPRFRDRVKYTVDDIRTIKRMWGEGIYTYGQLAERFNLTVPNISYIVGNNRWDSFL